MILPLLLAMLAGWSNRHQQQIITYLREENRVLKTRLRGRQLRLTNTDRRRLAALARPLGRQCLTEIATIATPNTLLRWYRRLIAQKFDGSRYRQQLGRPCVAEEGVTPHPTDAFMQQCARQLTDPFDGFLLGKRYLLHDRDTKFTRAFDSLLQESGVEPLLLPPRSPNLNAYCERFVRSIKEEALQQMLLLGEGSLHVVLSQYLEHYHQERNHQGLGNSLIVSEPNKDRLRGPVRRRERLGGVLSYYYRKAA